MIVDIAQVSTVLQEGSVEDEMVKAKKVMIAAAVITRLTPLLEC